MEDDKTKLKNLRDLRYNKILNLQNIILGSIGAALISVILSEKLPEGLTKKDLIIVLILTAFFSLVHFSEKLGKIEEEIEKL